MSKRIIVHIDMDAFFASVEQLDEPSYKNKPVIVGADPKKGEGRGVVATCSYEARRFGLHSAMPISKAYKRCPHGIFLRPRMNRYRFISQEVFHAFQSVSSKIEIVGIDEAYLDCSHLTEDLRSMGLRIKRLVQNKVGLTCSVGIASSRSIAKICSGMNKPDGLTICPHGQEKSFLAPLSVGMLNGVGEVTRSKLERSGMSTIGDIASKNPRLLERELGKWGLRLWELANGQDAKPLQARRERKSLSQERTFPEDVGDDRVIRKGLKILATEISKELGEKDLSIRTIGLKIRFSDFTTFTRDKSLDTFTREAEAINSVVASLYEKFLPRTKKVRLIGIRVASFRKGPQPSQLEFSF